MITHERRLSDIARPLRSFYMAMAELEEKAGPALFQLPPNLRKDLSLLRGLLSLVPHGGRTAVEFRHPSWRDDDVMEALREAGATLCIVDALRGDTPLVATARFGYLRLRRPMYSRRALAEWIERIRAQPWSEVFVYFKHAGAARAPALAHTMAQMLGTRPSDGATEIDAPSAEP